MSTNICKETKAEGFAENTGGNTDGAKVIYLPQSEKPTQFELFGMMYNSGFLEKAELSISSKFVLYALVNHYNVNNADMYPSQLFIAKHLGISEKSVERAIKELAAAGYVTYKTSNVNRYKFTALFFDSVKMSGGFRQNVGNEFRQNVGQTKKEKKEKNKGVFNEILNGENAEDQAACGASVQQGACNEARRTEEERGLRNKRTSCENGLAERGGDSPTTQYGRESSQSGARGGYSSAYRRENVSGGGYNKFGVNSERKYGGNYAAPQNRTVPTVKETEEYLKTLREDKKQACSPLDYTREEAVKWLASLPPMLHKSAFAVKLCRKYGLTPSSVEE